MNYYIIHSKSIPNQSSLKLSPKSPFYLRLDGEKQVVRGKGEVKVLGGAGGEWEVKRCWECLGAQTKGKNKDQI